MLASGEKGDYLTAQLPVIVLTQFNYPPVSPSAGLKKSVPCEPSSF